MGKFEEISEKWIATKNSRPIYHGRYSDRGVVHKSAGNVSDIEMGTVDLGYCETCSYVISAIVFIADCLCGDKNVEFYLSDYEDRELASVLNEILEFEDASV